MKVTISGHQDICPPRHRLFQDRDIVVIPHSDPELRGLLDHDSVPPEECFS